MKTKNWKVLGTDKAKDCKHTRFICEECYTLLFQQPVWTKSRALEAKRVMRRLSKAIDESELAHQ